MLRNIAILAILFTLFEGFCLLPQEYVVMPGIFRMLDLIIVILPLFALVCGRGIFDACSRFFPETAVILVGCLLILIDPLMAWLFFDQPYLKGLLLLRHSFSYLVFFMFVLLMKPDDRLEKTIRFLTWALAVWIVILILTKSHHDLGLIHFRDGYYGGGGFSRFGDSRLYFPYYNLPLLLYFIALARMLRSSLWDILRKHPIELFYAVLVTKAVLATYSRMLVFSFMVASGLAFLFARNRCLRYAAIGLFCVVVGIQASAMAAGGGISLIENTKLGKIALQSGSLEKEDGRKMQLKMYLENFFRSPLTGVGTIASGKYDRMGAGYLRSFRQYGIFNNTDLGYPKIAAENGLLGLSWVACLYGLIYWRSRQVLLLAAERTSVAMEEAVALGSRYFLVYMAISGVMFPHFSTMTQLPVTPLTLAILAVAAESLRRRPLAEV